MILDNFPHRLGTSCRSGSLRDVLEYHGYTFNEAMVFGLANALSFAYVRPDETHETAEFVLINGSIHCDFEEIAANLRLHYASFFPRDNDSAWEMARGFLADGHPVMMAVSLPIYLPYLQASGLSAAGRSQQGQPAQQEERVSQEEFLSESQRIFARLDTPAGNHITLMIGYDEETDEVSLLENNLSGIQTVPLAALKEARNPSTECTKPPKNEILMFFPPDELPPIREVVKKAIANTAHTLLYSGHPRSGLKSIEKLRREMPHWDELLTPTHLENSLFMMYYLSEVTGGGGFYRRFYARFLREASELLGDPSLLDCSRRYQEIAKKWRLLTKGLMEGALSDPAGAIRDPQHLAWLDDIVRLERDAALALEAAAARY